MGLRRGPLLRARRIWATAIAVITVAGVSPAAAQALPQPPDARPATAANGENNLPPGWRITKTDGKRALEWRSPRTVPVGDARVEFHADGKLVGVPEPAEDNRTFRLPLDDARTADLAGLQVLAAGRRLDQKPESARDGRSQPAAKAPAKLPAGSVDPGKPGTYGTVTGEYALDPVRLPGFPAPVEMRGVVVAPKGATGKRPVALFLHGRHATCYVPGAEDEVTIDWPCAKGAKPIPSHQGYLRDQKLLASQGYVTVSISANGINGQDGNAEDGGAQARSSLVRTHLARWADWAAKPAKAPAAVRKAPKADLSRVLLVGHSRGGEGVNRAAMDSLYPPPPAQDGYRGKVRWHIRGTVLIGPTIFGQNPVPDVPSLTILPGCDGDVSDLQGQVYADGTRGVSRGKALHSAVYMVGANHNYFNSEWTPGQAQAPANDDFWQDPEQPDPVCSPGTATRLTADQQHRAGATYIAAAARLFVAGDDRVRELVDGTGRRAPSADPARVLTHAVGANRGAGFLPDGPVKVTGGRLCSAIDPDPRTACLDPEKDGSSPHFAGWGPDRETGRRAVAMRWSAPGTAVKVRPDKPLSVKGARSLALRVFVPPNSSGTQLDVSVTDASGKRANLGRVQVDGLPGSDRTASSWAREVRAPITAATRAGLDLARIASLELTPRSRSGQAWLMDAWAWSPGTPAVREAPLTRVDIGRLKVKEGNAGTRTYEVPVRMSGKGSGTVRMFAIDPATGTAKERLVTVRPGGQVANLTVKVTGNTRYSWDVAHDVLVKAVRGAVVGSHAGGVIAENDDAMPTITMKPVADKVTEGKPLTWRLSLSAPADVELTRTLKIVPATGGPELTTKDVDRQWLIDTFGDVPDGDVPLSQLDWPYLWAAVPAGKTSAEVSVPTAADKVTEQTEHLVLQPVNDEDGKPDGPAVTGTVLDAP
ncbi:alpha/beta hydrolase family protein [Streptomyces sp. NPDC056437]|uniref:alpha/beta hydrolase family protein n=1 Tax=Streptomyces sp. NPDC056437 TaxID=3345816 RepID=UPI00367F0873